MCLIKIFNKLNVGKICLVQSSQVVGLAFVLTVSAQADGLSNADMAPHDGTMARSGSRVLEANPSLDHHYRNDMVAPDWRLYQQPQPYGYDSSPRERRRTAGYGRDMVPGSLVHSDKRWRCDPWRDACRGPEPVWTRGFPKRPE